MRYSRNIEPLIKKALEYFPVVLLSGPRQVGKSTLTMSLARDYFTLDSPSFFLASKDDPFGMVNGFEKAVSIDEVQKNISLLDAIKLNVDSNRVNGKFLLTGSANLMSFKNISDTLAGRIALLHMHPLSVTEIYGGKSSVIDTLFSGSFSTKIFNNDDTVWKAILYGGYPEVVDMDDAYARSLWYGSYIKTYIERDIRDFTQIRELDKFIRLLYLLAFRTTNLINKQELASEVAIDNRQIEHYIMLLEMIYQVVRLKPYSSNLSKRYVKNEKIYFSDCGILGYLLGLNSISELKNSQQKGLMVETFVLNELQKSISYSGRDVKLYFYRTHDKDECDFVAVRGDEKIVIEVKSAITISKSDIKTIKSMMSEDSSIKYGYLFYMGHELLSLGKNIWAYPLRAMFE